MKKQFLTALATVSLASTMLAGNAAAAGNASFSLSPSGGSFVQNSNFTVNVFENGTDVNVVTAKLTYDASKLSCLSVGGSNAFPNTVTATCGNGTVTISRYNATALSGSQQIGSITFKAAATGTGSINFASGSQIASNGTNVWNGNTAGGSYAVTAAPAATPAPTPATGGPKASTAPKAVSAAKATATPAANGQVAGTEATPTPSATPAQEQAAAQTGDVKTAASHSKKNWLWLLLLIPVIAGGVIASRKLRSAK